MLATSQGGVLVTDGRGAVVGALNIASVMEAIRGQLATVREDDDHGGYLDHAEGSAPVETPVVAADDEPGLEPAAGAGSATAPVGTPETSAER